MIGKLSFQSGCAVPLPEPSSFSFPPISAVAREHVDVEYSFFACASHQACEGDVFPPARMVHSRTAAAPGEETRDSTSGALVHRYRYRVRRGRPTASCHVVVFLSLARPPPPPSRHPPPLLLLPGIHIHGVDENVDLHLVARHAIHEMRVTKTPHASAPRFIVSRKRQNQNPFEGQRGKMEMRDRGASRSFPSAFPFARSA